MPFVPYAFNRTLQDPYSQFGNLGLGGNSYSSYTPPQIRSLNERLGAITQNTFRTQSQPGPRAPLIDEASMGQGQIPFQQTAVINSPIPSPGVTPNEAYTGFAAPVRPHMQMPVQMQMPAQMQMQIPAQMPAQIPEQIPKHIASRVMAEAPDRVYSDNSIGGLLSTLRNR